MSRIRMWSLTSALLVSAVFAGACGDSSDKSGTSATSTPSGSTLSAEEQADFDKQLKEIKDEKATRFVGKVEGTDAFIGIEQRGDAVKAYICDSKQISVWMTGKASGDTLSASKGPVSMTGTVGSGGTQVTGSVTMPDGSKHNFSADLATPPAGLYEANAPQGGAITRAGWVVLASGEQRGNAKTGTIVQPVSQLSQSTLTAALGGVQAPVIPAPGPVTNQSQYCEALLGLYKSLNLTLMEQTANGEDTTSTIDGMQQILAGYNNSCVGWSRTR